MNASSGCVYDGERLPQRPLANLPLQILLRGPQKERQQMSPEIDLSFIPHAGVVHAIANQARQGYCLDVETSFETPGAPWRHRQRLPAGWSDPVPAITSSRLRSSLWQPQGLSYDSGSLEHSLVLGSSGELDSHAGYTSGCMCTLNGEYSPRPNYQQRVNDRLLTPTVTRIIRVTPDSDELSHGQCPMGLVPHSDASNKSTLSGSSRECFKETSSRSKPCGNFGCLGGGGRVIQRFSSRCGQNLVGVRYRPATDTGSCVRWSTLLRERRDEGIVLFA
nr:hypothetical protein Iba_chr04aCG2020 [Ipomoea batatas]